MESAAYSDRTRLGWAETNARQRVNEIIVEERRQLEKKLASEKEGEHDVSRPYRTVAALRVPDSVSSKPSGDTEPISIPTVILEAEERSLDSLQIWQQSRDVEYDVCGGDGEYFEFDYM
ncbi:hypothetical protein CIHG_06466 [Coccidioides immitis H538.4]|uniref:Uncharacterized protein n=1 Tax=Coccidioides immitis H538.4 TaxID=396776 RepID=A0A0J8UMM2_COCIT|nr:hypothetical protein CIHG_06466 [Coccidioides immitis H538.4]